MSGERKRRGGEGTNGRGRKGGGEREKGVGRRDEEERCLWPWTHSLILCTHTKSDGVESLSRAAPGVTARDGVEDIGRLKHDVLDRKLEKASRKRRSLSQDRKNKKELVTGRHNAV